LREREKREISSSHKKVNFDVNEFVLERTSIEMVLPFNYTKKKRKKIEVVLFLFILIFRVTRGFQG